MQNDGDEEERFAAAKRPLLSAKSACPGSTCSRNLSRRNFLPAHGFSSSCGHLRYRMHLALFRRSIEKKNAGKRWPTCFCGESCPVVPFPSALTEYAPGNSVAVINGLVYESRGITLNWHTFPLPKRPPRNCRTYETAGGAGTAAVSATAFQPFPTTCSNCGAALTREELA